MIFAEGKPLIAASTNGCELRKSRPRITIIEIAVRNMFECVVKSVTSVKGVRGRKRAVDTELGIVFPNGC